MSQAGNEAGRTEKENKSWPSRTRRKSNPLKPRTRPSIKSASAPYGRAFWENENDKGTFYNVTFERRYKDAQGNWQTSHSYGENDLQDLRKAADLMHTGIVNARRDNDE